jgi:hypothetical protein
MFARIQSVQRTLAMPVIHCGDENGVEVFLLQQLAMIPKGLLLGQFSKLARGVEMLLINIADPADRQVPFPEQWFGFLQVICALFTRADDAEHDAVVGADHVSRGSLAINGRLQQSWSGHRRRQGGGLLQKRAARFAGSGNRFGVRIHGRDYVLVASVKLTTPTFQQRNLFEPFVCEPA